MLINKLIKNFILTIFMTSTLSSCSTAIEEYKQEYMPLDIKSYFEGEIIAWGMIQNFSQKVTRRFCVDIIGTWQENTGSLDETFYFNDGEISKRLWTLTKTGKQAYIGSAGDVIGQAYGKQSGLAFHWEYTLAVPVDGDVYHLSLDDWMYKIDDKHLFNRTSMNKLGIEVAEITLFFEKHNGSKTCKSIKSSFNNT